MDDAAKTLAGFARSGLAVRTGDRVLARNLASAGRLLLLVNGHTRSLITISMLELRFLSHLMNDGMVV